MRLQMKVPGQTASDTATPEPVSGSTLDSLFGPVTTSTDPAPGPFDDLFAEPAPAAPPVETSAPAASANDTATVVAPTSAPDSAPAATDGPATDAPAANKFARRRRTVKMVAFAVVALIAVGFVRQHGATPADVTSNDAAGSLTERVDGVERSVIGFEMNDTTPVGSAKIAKVLVDAAAHRAATGSYEGFTADGILIGAARDGIVAATYVDGECWYGGIIPGEPTTDPAQDPNACDPQLVADAAATLRANDTQNDALGYADAAHQLAAAAEAVVFWSSRNIVNGEMSVAGFPEGVVSGVAVHDIAVDGHTVTFEALDANGVHTGWCATFDVAGNSTPVELCG